MACKICETRRPRRFCPGVAGDICAICCGTEREVTVHCPLDCEYLQDARKHERLPALDPEKVPNLDIRVKEEFLRDNEPLLLFAARELFALAMRTPGAVDFDVKEALESLIRTYRTLESGLYYETRPNNPIAANIHGGLNEGLNDFRRRVAEQLGMEKVRDSDVLGVLVFLQRLEIQHNNGRKLGRAFVDSLRVQFERMERPEGAPAALPGSQLIVP